MRAEWVAFMDNAMTTTDGQGNQYRYSMRDWWHDVRRGVYVHRRGDVEVSHVEIMRYIGSSRLHTIQDYDLAYYLERIATEKREIRNMKVRSDYTGLTLNEIAYADPGRKVAIEKEENAQKEHKRKLHMLFFRKKEQPK